MNFHIFPYSGLEKTNDGHRWRILDILEEIGDPKTVSPLLSLLERTDKMVLDEKYQKP